MITKCCNCNRIIRFRFISIKTLLSISHGICKPCKDIEMVKINKFKELLK